MAGRRHGSQNRKLNAHVLKCRLKTVRVNWKQHKAFVSQPSSSAVHPKIPPNSVTNWAPGVQISEVIRDILFQTTTQTVKMDNFYCGLIDFFQIVYLSEKKEV